MWGPLTPTAEAQPLPSTGDDVTLPGLTDPPWGAWRTETLDEEGASINTETAVDDEGRVWVAHDDEPRARIGLKIRDEAGWHDHPADHDTAFVDDFALGPDGQGWVVWMNNADTRLEVFDPDEEAWSRIDVPTDGSNPRIAFGPDGETLHVILVDVGSPDVVKHGAYDLTAGEWAFESITTQGLGWLDMAVGPEGHVHAVWTRHNTASTYAHRTLDGTWQVEKTEECRDHALATDTGGTVHWVCNNDQGIVYTQRSSEGVEVSREVAQDGSELVPPRAGGDVGFSLDIVVDAHDRPHVVYTTTIDPFFPDDPTEPALPVYAVELADGWHSQEIDREGTWAGFQTSLALDQEGRPHVSYVHKRHAWAPSCAEPYNDCDQLRYAEPFAATAAWATDGVTGTVGVDGVG
ncbi:hypothetical protein BRD56_00700 [Thermoplasmatales archaeon SW_10_69_26]|nr:MAG: hypothetical protein BRD56_00700 [Thermoplasmatales archaeon SW_10_69_26]